MATQIEGYTVVLTGKGLERFRRQYKDQFMVVKHKYDAGHNEYPGRHDDHSKNFTRGSHWACEDGSFFICIDDSVGKAKWMKVTGKLSEGSFVEDESDTEDIDDGSEITVNRKEDPKYVDGPDQKEDADSGSGPEPDPDPEEKNTKKVKEDKEEEEKGEGIPTKEELEEEGIDTKAPGKELDEKAPMTKKNKESKGVEFSAGEDAPDEATTTAPKKKDLYKVEIPEDVPFKSRLEKDNRVQNLGHLIEHIKNNTLHELKHINEDRAKAIKEAVKKHT